MVSIMGKKKAVVRDVILNFRVSADEKEAWEAEAKKVDRPLSGWIRFVANQAIGAEDEK